MNLYPYLSFHLKEEFLAGYASEKPDWAFPIGAGNTFGEIAYLTKYSRLLTPEENGTPFPRKERWHETCQRVVEGVMSILKDHCRRSATYWNATKAERTAEEMYDRMFYGKWLPPGRGLWMMGTRFVQKYGSAALNNCAFISTVSPMTDWAPRLMEMSMLGVGVGFDTRGAYRSRIEVTDSTQYKFIIGDSREGWAEALRNLLAHYTEGAARPIFDYSLVREAGAPIRGFGGTSAGPIPLQRLLTKLDSILHKHNGKFLTRRLITDIGNLIGKCVVSANVRSSAEIVLDEGLNEEFLDLKNHEVNPERVGPDGWGYISNNSVLVNVGEHDWQSSGIGSRIAKNGEPGVVWLDMMREYGRLKDGNTGADLRAAGVNPCAEQSLEDRELCTLVETFPMNCDDDEDFYRTLKFAFLYAKAVTLVPTHWEDTNSVMQRNRRIGLSITGIAQYVELNGWDAMRNLMDDGYGFVKNWDEIYSGWLGVRNSIKVTTVKPSGTVSLLIAKPDVIGNTPGAHWPVASGRYVRTMRLGVHEDMLPLLEAAGYKVEPNFMNPEFQSVVYLPVQGPEMRSEGEVSLWEKAELAATAQYYWSDNAVSFTGAFREDEAKDIGRLLNAYEGKLKCVSFLPVTELDAPYPQMPYSKVPDEEWDALRSNVSTLDLSSIYMSASTEASGEMYCSTDYCEIKEVSS